MQGFNWEGVRCTADPEALTFALLPSSAQGSTPESALDRVTALTVGAIGGGE